ncbi:hypothetical protein GCM10022239_16330 [Leifsonia bigeumensis]|uniref:DUF2157 domain-containing protein n=1 Tax=Leifsonella bigeumensis TaxID=433643 RepID=A0ABP7FMP9_9MICO
MADDGIDYSAYAGRIVFPRNPQDLLSTNLCPACFAALGSTVCSVCGLEVGHPDAAKLFEASVAAAGKLDERVAIIGKMRYEAGRAVAAPVAASTAAPVAAPVAAPAVTAPAVSIHEPADADGLLDQQREVAAAPRRSSVQVTLLIVGVSLLSVAAIFFLVYAFINFGIVWRSVIIGAITVAAFVAASLLRRRNLTATAEGIAAFAVVLVYLDAWALRANNLFDAERADTAVYWGIVLIAAAAGFILWHRVSALRIPNIAGFATFAPGVGVLTAGLTQHLSAATSGLLVFSSIAVAGLVHRWAARPSDPATVERVIVLVTTAIALLASLSLCLSAYPGFDWAPTIAALVVAAIGAGHVWALLARPTTTSVDRIFARLFSGFAGVVIATAVAFSASRIDDDQFRLVWPLLAATAVALALEAISARIPADAPRTSGAIAAWCAAAVAALILTVPLFHAAASTLFAAARTSVPPWSIEPTDAVARFSPDTGWAVLALAALTALAAIVWALTRRLHSPARSTAVLWAAAITALVAVPELRTHWAVMVGWLFIAVACLLALLLTRGHAAVRPRHRVILVTTMIVAGVLGYLVGLATTTTWWMGTLVIVGMLIAARSLVKQPGARAALLGSGIALALLSVGSVADQLTLETDFGLEWALANRFVLTSIAAIVVLLGAAIPDGAVSALDRRVEFWVAGAASAVSLPLATILVTRMPASGRAALLLPEYWTSLATALLLLLALALWLGLRRNQALRSERIAASIAAAPALYLAVSSFARLLDLPEFVASVVPITAALLAAAGALTVTTLRPTTAPRWTRELGVALVGIPAVLTAVRADAGLAWLVLLLAAVAVLLLAIDGDGLFTSRSVRHHLGWLALALATAGLWWRLNGDRVTDLEYYVVPLSLALIAIAALIARAARREQPARDAKAAPLITLGGLLVSLLPLGVNAATGTATYAIWLFAISAVLLIAGSAVIGSAWWRWTADACALAGAIGVIVVAVGRALFLPVAELERDTWLVAVFLVLMVAAFLQARTRPDGNGRLRATGSQSLGLVAMTAVLALETPAFREGQAGDIRLIALVLLFSALHVVAFLVSRPPLTRLVAVVAIVFAAIAGLAGAWMDVLHPVEVASIPIAVALLVTGFTELGAVPTARSWRWLAPGTAVLLLPSLFATIDDRPLWRLVGLGVVGIAVIVIAVVRRLQAPFVIGVVVVLIHGIATFLPQLRAAYEFLPWWLWLGAGGVLLIVLAARYEQRIRNLKSVAMKFAALR